MPGRTISACPGVAGGRSRRNGRQAPAAATAFRELYAWYGRHAAELYPIHRDMASMPVSTQAAMRADAAALGDALADGHAIDGPAGRVTRALARHLTSFWTWRSLVHDEGLDPDVAAGLAAGLLAGEMAAPDQGLPRGARAISPSRPPRTVSRPTAGR